MNKFAVLPNKLLYLRNGTGLRQLLMNAKRVLNLVDWWFWVTLKDHVCKLIWWLIS